jgi:hypothetical protein
VKLSALVRQTLPFDGEIFDPVVEPIPGVRFDATRDRVVGQIPFRWGSNSAHEFFDYEEPGRGLYWLVLRNHHESTWQAMVSETAVPRYVWLTSADAETQGVLYGSGSLLYPGELLLMVAKLIRSQASYEPVARR